MTWEQKLQAIKALGDASLKMRKPGDWYVSQIGGPEIADGHTLSSAYGNGPNPEAAVEAHWRRLTEVSAGQWLVLHPMTPDRRAVRWNGFMWEEIAEERAA